MEILFQERLKYLRIYYNISQKELAKNLNITPKVISNYEHGRVEPTCQAVIDIAQFFNVSTDYLLGLTDKLVPVHFRVYAKKAQ